MLNLNKAFIFENRFPTKKLESITREDGRWYKVPNINDSTEIWYESVTTAIGKASDRSHLEKWKKRIGEKQAAYITKRGATRGTTIHNMLEQYMLDPNNPNITLGKMPDIVGMYHQFCEILQKSVQIVYATECTLYSHQYRLAGTCDLVAKVFDKLTLIDYKTSRSFKKRENIHDYFLQMAAYSFMIEEMFGVKIETNIILMCIEDAHKTQVFFSDPYKYMMDQFFLNRRKDATVS